MTPSPGTDAPGPTPVDQRIGTAVSQLIDHAGAAVDSTEVVCDEFAGYAKAGQPADRRPEVISSIGEVIDAADPSLRDAYGPLADSVNSDPGAVAVADDVFAQACFDAGWKG